MKNRIENLTDLRAEILFLTVKRSQQESALSDEVEKIKRKLEAPKHFIQKVLNLITGDNAPKNAKLQNPEEHQDWITSAFRVGIPVLLNKVLFRQSGFIIKTLVALLSQKAAVNVNKDILTEWTQKATHWIKNFKSKRRRPAVVTDYGIPPDSETY